MDKYLDKMAKLSPAARYGGLAAIVVAITALNFFFVVTPVEDALVRLESTQRALDLQLAEKQEIAQNLNERRREMDVLEQKLAEALTELPENKDVDELLAQLNDVGKKAGLEISSVTPGPEAPGEFFSRIPIQMAVKGNYHEVALFLQDMATMRRIVNVSGIKFDSPTTKNGKVMLNTTFLATTFRFLDQSKK
jgi:type IV pilus assembly protein PilO